MNYLRLLLFFFAMLAPLQLTSAECCKTWPSKIWERCTFCRGYTRNYGKWKQIGKLGDDHTLTMTTAITTAMTMATTKKLHQDFPKIILCDFRVSFVSQINWQPIGKLLFMIQPRWYQGRLMIQFVICTKCVYPYMATSVASCIAVSENKSCPLKLFFRPGSISCRNRAFCISLYCKSSQDHWSKFSCIQFQWAWK